MPLNVLFPHHKPLNLLNSYFLTLSLQPNTAKSKIDKFSNFTNLVKLKNKRHESTAQQLSNEWSHLRVLSIESNVRRLYITQGFTLGGKGLTLVISLKWLPIKSRTTTKLAETCAFHEIHLSIYWKLTIPVEPFSSSAETMSKV